MSRLSLDDAAWRKLAANIKDRDGHQCILCGATDDLTVDHLTPLDLFTADDWENGLDRDPENLATLCRGCNGRKSNKTMLRQAWVNRRWLDRLVF